MAHYIYKKKTEHRRKKEKGNPEAKEKSSKDKGLNQW